MCDAKPVSAKRVVMLVPMRALLVCLIVVSCTKANPEFCEVEQDCSNGFVCDLETHGCVEAPPPPDPECSVEIQCTDPLKPICGADQTCHGCVLDDECDSQVCRSDGSCEEAGNIVYASPDGLSSGDCTADAPCVVNFARTLLDASRATLRLANGTYVAVNDFVANGTAIAVVGGSSASVTFERSGLITPLFEARSGATLSLRGFALNEGVVSSGGSTVVITRLLFDHQSITVRPWISGSGTIEVRDSELRDSNSDGCGSFTGTLDGSNLDHLTSLSVGREGGTGFGTTPSA